MSVFGRLCFALSAGVLLFANCTHPPATVQTSVPDIKPKGARLSTAEVIRIAKQAAERHGTDLRRYKGPSADYDSINKEWFVAFLGLVAMPGNHFSVWVDDQTSETRLFGGR